MTGVLCYSELQTSSEGFVQSSGDGELSSFYIQQCWQKECLPPQRHSEHWADQTAAEDIFVWVLQSWHIVTNCLIFSFYLIILSYSGLRDFLPLKDNSCIKLWVCQVVAPQHYGQMSEVINCFLCVFHRLSTLIGCGRKAAEVRQFYLHSLPSGDSSSCISFFVLMYSLGGSTVMGECLRSPIGRDSRKSRQK